MPTTIKQRLADIPVEGAHGGTGSRQMLVQPEHITTQFLEAITKGFLKSGGVFDWHNHIDTDEIFIVTQGNGKYYYKERESDPEQVFEYEEGDVITAPGNHYHKIVAEGPEETQGFFVRVKAK